MCGCGLTHFLCGQTSAKVHPVIIITWLNGWFMGWLFGWLECAAAAIVNRNGRTTFDLAGGRRAEGVPPV